MFASEKNFIIIIIPFARQWLLSYSRNLWKLWKGRPAWLGFTSNLQPGFPFSFIMNSWLPVCPLISRSLTVAPSCRFYILTFLKLPNSHITIFWFTYLWECNFWFFHLDYYIPSYPENYRVHRLQMCVVTVGKPGGFRSSIITNSMFMWVQSFWSTTSWCSPVTAAVLSSVSAWRYIEKCAHIIQNNPAHHEEIFKPVTWDLLTFLREMWWGFAWTDV